MNDVQAVIWDFDGTLIDTSSKNLNVTRKILQHIKPGTDPYQLAALKDLPSYIKASLISVNWRDFYQNEFGLDENETDLAGELWTEFQLQDETEINFFPGITELLQELDFLPHGIVSQNSRHNIIKLMKKAGIIGLIKEVIGYEEVSLQEQKPHPDGLIKCIERLLDHTPATVYYIGDHETDIICAYNAAQVLTSRGIEVKSIAAFYNHQQDIISWKIQPDHIAWQVSDIAKIIHESRTQLR